ncbi:hypothetical protein MHO82_11245 [Vibrio sp. Of7-15]|uniref:hypothetical protein n=1 Tax=Vibrio sp. Of7-15 TaxID=2724879 RepID=UPI001EF3A6F9|nr:hypothetical protein [Vibrio sp. Of7-15]MCG7497442.1 hypothetical protein [Vibrio sp. Of7-15]
MIEKQQLVSSFEAALLALTARNSEQITHYVKQDMFAEMLLSVEYWDGDMFWNIWEKDGEAFEHSGDMDPDEFIILSDYCEDEPSAAQLSNLLQSMGDILGADCFETLDRVRFTHEALHEALQSNKVKLMLEQILKQNKNYSSQDYEKVVLVDM